MLESELERLIIRAFEQQGFTTSRPPQRSGQQVDLLLKQDGATTVVEVRGRLGRADVTTVRRLIDARQQFGADRAILVAYGRVTAEARALAEQQDVHILSSGELEALLHQITGPATPNTDTLTDGEGDHPALSRDAPTIEPSASDAPDSP